MGYTTTLKIPFLLSLISALFLLSHAARLALPVASHGDLAEDTLRKATVLPIDNIDGPLAADGSRRHLVRRYHRGQFGVRLRLADGMIASVHPEDGEAGGELKPDEEKVADGWLRLEEAMESVPVEEEKGERKEYKLRKKAEEENSDLDSDSDNEEEEEELQLDSNKKKNKDKEKNKDKDKEKNKDKDKNKEEEEQEGGGWMKWFGELWNGSEI